MNRLKTDVVIIGAGIIGSSIAYHLAQKNIRVTVVEKGDMADGSSGACDGLVFLQSKKPGIHLQLAMESRQRFDRLALQLPVPIEYRNTGGLVVIETEDEWAAMTQFVDRQQETGLEVSLVTKKQIRSLAPCLSGHIVGASYSPLDGQVNPIALTLGFVLGARHLGATILRHTTVTGIEKTAGRVSAVETTTGRIETDIVVNAAGAHAAQIGALAGLDIPIRPRRGQLIVTETCPPMIDHCMISARYIAAKFNPDIAGTNDEGVSIEQTHTGQFLLGSTREFVGFNKQTTPIHLHRIAAKAVGIIPALTQVHAIRAFAGLRPYTPDGLPVLGPVAAVPGFFMAAGHEGDGIALSPITGHLIAQLITTGKSDIPLDDFRLDRFTTRKESDEVPHA